MMPFLLMNGIVCKFDATSFQVGMNSQKKTLPIDLGYTLPNKLKRETWNPNSWRFGSNDFQVSARKASGGSKRRPLKKVYCTLQQT